ncbi:MAG: hypothetical protein AAF802_26320 [Planctomycetota bacterium]
MRELLHPAGPVTENETIPGAPKVNRFYELAQIRPDSQRAVNQFGRRTPSALVAQRRKEATITGHVRANPLVAGTPPALRRFNPEVSGRRQLLESAQKESQNQSSPRPDPRMAIDFIGSHLEPTSAEPIALDRFANDRVDANKTTLRDQIRTFDQSLASSEASESVSERVIPQLPPPSQQDFPSASPGNIDRIAKELIAEREDSYRDFDASPSPYRMDSDRIKPMEVDQLIASESAKTQPRLEKETPKKTSLSERLTSWSRRIAAGRSQAPTTKEPTPSSPKSRRGGLFGSLFDQRN